MLKLKAVKQQKGFTLVEVLVAIVISTLFVTVTMQAMVMAAYLKVQAKYNTQGMTLIQQNLEQVKYAATAPDPTLYTAAKCSAADYSSGYAKVLSDKIDADVSIKLSTADALSSAPIQIGEKSFKVTRSYDTTSPVPYNVLRLTYKFQQWNVSTSAFVVSPVATVATIYTEVIPDAAFNCP